MSKEKAVIILSGGMDSGVLLAKIRKENPDLEIHSLNFNYGSNHNPKEGEKAIVLSEKYNTTHITVDLPFIKKLFKSSLLQGAEAVPEGHYAEESMKTTVVPFRNGIMLSIATGYAESIGAKQIFIGNHSGDHFIYPDCRPPFIDGMEDAIRNGTFDNISLKSPFLWINKRDIGVIGNDMGFDFKDTYTCYKGAEKHCGKCGSCTERKEALEGFDPTEYEE